MEDIINTNVGTSRDDLSVNVPDVIENRQDSHEISQDLSSNFLTASDLFLSRVNYCKNKNKDEDLELYKGPKLYHPNESAAVEEIVEDIMLNNRKSLELQRIAKIRDCMKAEWDDELKVAIVPFLKGKTTQHMGINVRGKCALTPEEAIFLLEKGSIEIMHNKMSLSIEEAYSVMLKGRLAVEKYEVYSFLSQQGFIVVAHQTRIRSIYEKLMKSRSMKRMKRKADVESGDLPKQKRLTFTGVLASNSEINSSSQSNASSRDNLLSDTESSNKIQPISESIPVNDLNKSNTIQDVDDKMNLEESEDATISPDSTYHIQFNDSTEKEVSSSNFDSNNVSVENNVNLCSKDIADFSVNKVVNDQMNKIINKDELAEKNVINDNEMDVENSHGNEINVEHVDNNQENVVKNIHDGNRVVRHSRDGNEIDVEHIDDNEIDVENDDDTNEIIIDDHNAGKSRDINVEDSMNISNNNDEYLSSDDSSPLVCDESTNRSVDIYSCSPSAWQANHDSERGELQNRPPKEQDDEVTLVEVKKTEKKPLAVIDLLSDEENSYEDQDRVGSNSDETHESETNGENSDDDIQVIDVFPVSNSNAQGASRSKNSVKLESKEFKIPIDISNVKSSYTMQMKFPDAYNKDLICIPRPPNHLLPLHVQPAKEAYVLSNLITSHSKQGRLWNSYKDLQDYQRERRLERSMNSFHNRSGPFRDQNNSFSNELPPFSMPENSRDVGFNRNNQNFSLQQGRNLYQPSNLCHERSGPLLPRPTYNPQNHMPFSMNIHNLQNLSSTNPAAFVNEIQRTVYSVASSMISSILGQHMNPNTSSPIHRPAFGEPRMGFSPHPTNNYSSPGYSSPPVYNSSGRSDFNPVRFPPESAFPGERYPGNSSYMSENNWRPPMHVRQRNYAIRGPLFPCKYRNVRKKRDWHDVKAAVEAASDSDSGSDIEEVPINLNQFLWSNDMQPLNKPGSKLPVADVLKTLCITQRANLCDTKLYNDRYLPATTSLEISFDAYLPNSKFKKSEPTTPKCRIIVVRSSDPIPRYSELVSLQRKLNDEASLQIAVVDHSDISFYSFNSINVPEIVPFEN